MLRKLLLMVMYVALPIVVFAQNDLDEIILQAGKDVAKAQFSQGQRILFIAEFDAPTQNMAVYLQSNLMASLTEAGTVQVVSRKHLGMIEQELEFQYSGQVDEATTLSLCRRLGANGIIFGQLTELDNIYTLEIRVLDVETAAYQLIRNYQIQRSSKTEQLLNRAAIYHKTAIGLRAEVNKNSIDKVAVAGALILDYTFFRKLALGVKVLVSRDFFDTHNSVTTVEPLGTLRFYAVSPTGEPATGLYVEGQGGVSLAFVNSAFHYTFNVGLGVGYRFGFNNFYLEPELRGGYPYLFGAGMNFGLRF